METWTHGRNLPGLRRETGPGDFFVLGDVGCLTNIDGLHVSPAGTYLMAVGEIKSIFTASWRGVWIRAKFIVSFRLGDKSSRERS